MVEKLRFPFELETMWWEMACSSPTKLKTLTCFSITDFCRWNVGCTESTSVSLIAGCSFSMSRKQLISNRKISQWPKLRPNNDFNSFKSQCIKTRPLIAFSCNACAKRSNAGSSSSISFNRAVRPSTDNFDKRTCKRSSWSEWNIEKIQQWKSRSNLCWLPTLFHVYSREMHLIDQPSATLFVR